MTHLTSIGQLLTSLDAWAALVSLSALEIVLGIDNVIFISILVSRLDPQRGRNARRLGMLLAVIFRIVLLFALTSLLGLSAAVFTVWNNAFSWHDLILIAGGLFLIAKATHELHAQAEAGSDEKETSEVARAAPARSSMLLVVSQIILVDLIFSIDSIITAIGMAQDIRIMIAAVLIAVAAMYAASGAVAGFVAAYPTLKTLALAFLLLIGVALVADGFDFHIPRGYVYFAMAFAAAVETFNVLTARRRRGSRTSTSPDVAAGSLSAPSRATPGSIPGQGGRRLKNMTAASKILLVTGASRGIGAATARLAAAQGYDVAVNYAHDKAGADAVAAEVEAAGRKAMAVQADVAVEADVERMFAEVDNSLGRLTHLVCNTGITGPLSRLEALPAKTAREVIDTNVLGSFLCARAAIPRMSTRHGGAGGSIVFISSAAATIGGAGEYVIYAASKGAVESLSIGLSRELAGDGIRSNVVSPGPIATGIHPPGRLERVVQAVPMGRAGTMDEVAQAVMFLLSEQSSYTTGAVLRVAGGR